MNRKRRFAGALVAVALLLALGAGTAHAQTPYFPNASPYSCYWELNGTSGFAFVTFVNLAGNNYLRRGIQRTVYPPVRSPSSGSRSPSPYRAARVPRFLNSPTMTT